MTSCVAVCPVDCIHPTKDEKAFELSVAYVWTNGSVQAILPEEEDIPNDWQKYIKINADYYKRTKPTLWVGSLIFQ